jgi:hypothetical protein
MNSLIKTALCSAIAGMFLAACGGGGGGSATDTGTSGGNTGNNAGGNSGPVTPQLSFKAELLIGDPGGNSYLDGQGDMARLSEPQSIVADSKGNIFVLDLLSVRKITPDGNVSIFAGAPYHGISAGTTGDGTGTSARLAYGTAMTIDSADNIFVASGASIKKITKDGVVTTYVSLPAGYRYVNGSQQATTADIVADSKGNLYYYDGQNQQISVISPDGKTAAYVKAAQQIDGRNAQPGTSFLGNVTAMTIDGADNLYVADSVNGVLIAISPNKAMSIPDTRLSVKSQIGPVTRMTADQKGNLYIPVRSSISVFDKNGNLNPYLGNPGFPGDLNGKLLFALARKVGAQFWTQQGEMVFIDENVVRKIDRDGNLSTVAGKNTRLPQNAVSQDKYINIIRDLAVGPDQKLYASEGYTIRQLNLAEKTLTVIPALAKLNQTIIATSLSFNPAGNLCFTYPAKNQIFEIDASGAMKIIGGSGADSGQSSAFGKTVSPRVIRHISDGRTIIVDNNMLRQLNADGSITDIAGALSNDPATDGAATTARFVNIKGISSDSKGNIFVVENNRGGQVRQTLKDGTTRLYAGSFTEWGNADGMLTEARFICPSSVTRDDKENLYIADSCANAIRMITKEGKAYTLKVQWATPDGKQYQVLPGPFHIVSSSGKLYVYGDSNNSLNGALFQIPLN